MADELFLTGKKLVVAKEGFNASDPSLPDGNKMFDSDWLFASTIVEAGLYLDPAPPRFKKPPQNLTRWDEKTDWSSPNVINFTPLDYVPTVMLISLADPRYWAYHGMVLLSSEPLINDPDYYWRTGAITVTESKITIPRIYNRGNGTHCKESFIYLIMAM
ncbi:hypothetical protein [Pseudochrobactrum sp. HB0163]|uniref:hypothetical protein n=1 Tax=Pseudochrobactrum sp. HB0163 TaxID=3450708 RepID=UPI003F6DFE72